MEQINQIEALIKEHIENAQVILEDLPGSRPGHNHLGVCVVSDLFEGKSILDQHQMVMNALKEELKTNIHAVKIKTFTQKAYQSNENTNSRF